MIVDPGDFDVEPAGAIPPEQVLRDPRYVLYCFDPERKGAIFVECDDPRAVESAPFYYVGQRLHARAVVTMPLETFHGIAETVQYPPEGLIFVHSVGRCGSTLLSKALEAVPSVHSLSEPDDLTQLTRLWVGRSVPREDVPALLVSSIKWRCKEPSSEWLAIKMRSEVMVLAELFGSCFPTARHLFLYRDGLSWMRTVHRSFRRDSELADDEELDEMRASWARLLPLVGQYLEEGWKLDPVQVRILGWITSMEGYLRLREMGVPTCAARFEDMVADPRRIIGQLLAFCGIRSVNWDEIQPVLDRDSQAGTMFGREERKGLNRELTDRQADAARALIASRPRLGRPDVIVPDTIQPPR
jgi:hypothetical protein